MISGTSMGINQRAPGASGKGGRGLRRGLRNPVPLVLLPLLFCASAPTAQDSGEPARSGSARWGANYFPNVTLTTHEGKSVRFFDDLIKDKVVVINFIYTTCPDVCPLETVKLKELQAILGDRVGRDVFMYSITIDPGTDTPEVLNAYAEQYHVGPGWSFLTGAEEDITLLRKRLGLYIEEIQDEDSSDHNLSLIIGNQATGRWMKRSPFEDPYFLADQVGTWLHNWKTPALNQDSYANAPQLRAMSTGERLFQTRCAACHVIGAWDQVPAHQSGRQIGPDLLNVTQRRDRAWLARWLEEPDAMLAEKDPLAVELYERHRRVPMPNMDLKEPEVAALLEYLEVESRRFEASERAAGTGSEHGPNAAPTSCCQKDTNAVLSAENTAASLGLGEGGEDHGGGGGVSTAVVGWSVGLGCIFLSLAALTQRRSRSSVEGAQQAQSNNGAGRAAPLSFGQEANK